MTTDEINENVNRFFNSDLYELFDTQYRRDNYENNHDKPHYQKQFLAILKVYEKHFIQDIANIILRYTFKTDAYRHLDF